MGKIIKSLVSYNGYNNSYDTRTVSFDHAGTFMVVPAIGGASGTNYGAITTSGGTEVYNLHNSVRSNTYSSYNEYVGLRTYIAKSNSSFSISSSFQKPNHCKSQNIIAFEIEAFTNFTTNTSTTYTTEGTRTYSLDKGSYIVSCAVCGGNDDSNYATITASANKDAEISNFVNAKSIGNGDYTTYLGSCCFEIEVVEDSTTLTVTTLRNGNKSVAVAMQIIKAEISEVSADDNPNGSGTFTGTGLYSTGSNVSLEAIPQSGWQFLNWSLAGFTKLDYIESTGSQYIDCNLQAPVNMKFEIDCMSTVNGYTDNPLIGISNNNNSGYRVEVYRNGNNKWSMFVHGQSSGTTATVANATPNNTRVTLVYEQSTGTQRTTVDGQTMTMSTDVSVRNYTYLFSYHGNSRYYGKHRIYEAKIWTNGNLVRHYIPVMRNSDSAVGMFDIVNFAFYNNAGSGTFVYGSSAGILTFTSNPLNFIVNEDFTLIGNFGRMYNCRFKVNGVWKNAIMYKKINGQWIAGDIRYKVNGSWKNGS